MVLAARTRLATTRCRDRVLVLLIKEIAPFNKATLPLTNEKKKDDDFKLKQSWMTFDYLHLQLKKFDIANSFL